MSSQSLSSTNATNFGQFFIPTLTSDIVGWRPTAITLRAMLNKNQGGFRVQMRRASPALLLPTSTVLEEQLVDSSTLPASMTTRTFDFSMLPRLSPGDAICVALMWDSGQGPGKFESNSSGPGMLKTSSTPTNWSYVTNSCLSTQIFGIAMRSGSQQTATTQYLLTLGISLRAGANNSPIAQTSALALNHPELVAALWELKFDQDPTTVDVNGDGAADWHLASGAAFNMASLIGGAWNTSSDTLSTAPGNEFNGITVADLRMQSTATGATAGFSINACRTGNQCVPLTAALVMQADGTQTLTISQSTGGSASTALISFSNLPSSSVDLHLVIDPTAVGVAITINGVQRGTIPFAKVSISDASKSASIFGSGGTARFYYARVRVLGALP